MHKYAKICSGPEACLMYIYMPKICKNMQKFARYVSMKVICKICKNIMHSPLC